MTFELKETCPKRGYWCSFRLVDEHGNAKPYAGLDYILHDRMGMPYSGTLDDEGYGYLENFYCGPLILDMSMPYQIGEKWYEDLIEREYFPLPLTALQVAAEQSPTGPRDNGRTYLARQRAELEQAAFLQVEVRDFANPDEAAHLPAPDTTLESRPWPYLKEACTHSNTQPRIALMANKHHVLEVKALRAFNPLLSHDKAFCALNAYHLSIMALLSYAPFHKDRKHNETPTPPPYKEAGCIGAVLQSQLARCERPTRFSDGGPYHLLTEEVPYSKRLEVVPYDPVRYAKEAKGGWEHPEDVHFLHDESDTQAFITHNDKVILISVRGTASITDILRDLDAKQVPYLADEGGKGNAHRGFYDSFEIARKFVERYMNTFYTGNQTIMVCGHSLGGAIALLLAEWLRLSASKPKVMLYTIGAPRAGNQSFVKAAADLTHHRTVNHNDPVPGVPSTWMDAEWKTVLPGTTLLIASIGSPWIGLAMTLGGLLNFKDDDYEHHGEQWHFMPRKPGKNSVLWQPGCAAIEQKTCAEFAADIELKGDMPLRAAFLRQALSAAEHSSDGGYSRNALTTLLRWHASVHRGGKLLTDDEREQLGKQIKPLRAEMEQPIHLSYERFRHNLRTRPHPRLSQTSEVELRGLFRTSQERLESLRHDQANRLSRVHKRLKAQDERLLTWQDVFGDIPKNDAMIKLIDEWLDRPENKEAAALAKLFTPSEEQQNYV